MNKQGIDAVLTKSSKAYESISENLLGLTEGVIVSIDPSIGSRSSQPGYAVYVVGRLRDSGVLEIQPDLPVWKRLQRLAFHIRKLYAFWEPDILVYEEIPSMRFGGGNANSHASLLKAVGVVLSVSGPSGYVGLHPMSWKKLTRASYEKSDENDAVEMGWIAINEARRIIDEKETKPGRKWTAKKQIEDGTRKKKGKKKC